MKEFEVCDYRFDEGMRTRKDKGIMPTIPARDPKSVSGVPYAIERERESKVEENNIRKEGENANIRIRKLTPKECWRIRLMGWKDSDFSKAEAVVSNSQLYKQAGNSIVVQVLEAIFKEML